MRLTALEVSSRACLVSLQPVAEVSDLASHEVVGGLSKTGVCRACQPGYLCRAAGNLLLLSTPEPGMICSSQCPGTIVLKTYDLVRGLRDRGTVMVGGFHSPREKESLSILLRGRQPIIICPLATSTEPTQLRRRRCGRGKSVAKWDVDNCSAPAFWFLNSPVRGCKLHLHATDSKPFRRRRPAAKRE